MLKHPTAFTEVEALAMLADIPLLGSIKIRLLIEYFGSAQEALAATPEQLIELPGFGPKLIRNWIERQTSSRWKKNFELVQQYNTQLISYTHAKYPKRLLEITDYPMLLYIKGEIRPSDARCLAIVGTRNPTIYGQEMASRFAEELASLGFTIVSGLARGIDTYAHVAALKNGRTLAVIGSGLANIYPRENEALAAEICRCGSLISEFSMSTPPDKQNFPQRNRIVSGMTLGTLLIEAPESSGAMITMDRAFRQKRKTFAIPGRADIDNFRGNHLLIRNGQARLVESAKDVAQEFDSLLSDMQIPQKKSIEIVFDKEEKTLWDQLPNEEVTFDQIVRLSQLPVAKLNVLLMSLYLKKAIKEFPGKTYKRIVLGT